MGRQNERGLELTWHRPSKRWRKRIEGRDHWFGGGNGVSDRTSYRAALEKYRKFRDDREAAMDHLRHGITARPVMSATPVTLESLSAVYTAMVQMTRAMNPTALIAGIDVPYDPEVAWKYGVPVQLLTSVPPRQTDDQPADEPARTTKTSEVDRLLDQFVAEQKRRTELTIQNPDAIPPKQRLGGSALRCVITSIEQMRKHFHKARLTEFGDQTEQALASFRKSLDDAVGKGKLKGQTVNAYTKAVGPFFRWAWSNRLVAEQPRNLAAITRKYAKIGTAQPLSVEVIRKLWAAAAGDDRMRAWIAVGLNCGAYAMDLATLKPEHLTADGCIARYRHKTTVPMKHKLWPITLELIRKTRDDEIGLVWVRKKPKGTFPLVEEKAGGGGKYDGVGRLFDKVCKRADVRATWSQLRDTSAHYVENVANGDRTSNPELVSQFLGHSDPRMARFYLDQRPERLNRAMLDAAIDKLAEIYNLA
ncbi:MAG: hypothetical protein WD042_11685 [Phycisphaeraceae bacterium]